MSEEKKDEKQQLLFQHLFEEKKSNEISKEKFKYDINSLKKHKNKIINYSNVLLSNKTFKQKWEELKILDAQHITFKVIAVLMILIVCLFCVSEFAYLLSILKSTYTDIFSNFGNVEVVNGKVVDEVDTKLTELGLKNIINILLFLETLETFNATMDSVNDNERRNSKWIKVIFLVSIAAILRKVITLDFDKIQTTEFVAPSILIIILTLCYIGISLYFNKQDKMKQQN